jgi:hypothetical protein
MIVRCSWHKPIPIYLRDKPPFEDRRVSDGMCEECMRVLFREAGMKMEAREGKTGDPESEIDL